jgi:hypothetical protein
MEVIANAQASSIAHSTLLEAMIMSHPNPAALRQAWYDISAPRIAATSSEKIGRGGDHQVSADLIERLQNWTEKVERYSQRRASDPE